MEAKCFLKYVKYSSFIKCIHSDTCHLWRHIAGRRSTRSDAKYARFFFKTPQMITFENNDLFKCQSNATHKVLSRQKTKQSGGAQNKNNEGVRQQWKGRGEIPFKAREGMSSKSIFSTLFVIGNVHGPEISWAGDGELLSQCPEWALATAKQSSLGARPTWLHVIERGIYNIRQNGDELPQLCSLCRSLLLRFQGRGRFLKKSMWKNEKIITRRAKFVNLVRQKKIGNEEGRKIRMKSKERFHWLRRNGDLLSSKKSGKPNDLERERERVPVRGMLNTSHLKYHFWTP